MNKILRINLLFLLFLSIYLMVANLGLLGVSFCYEQDSYSPWRSHFWPRTNYEVVSNNKIIFEKSIWLDIKLPVMFEQVVVEIQGQNLGNLELVWKEQVDGEILLLSDVPDSGKLFLNFSALPQPHYLIFSIKEGQEVALNNLKVSFSKPRWLYNFKKNVLK